MSQSARSVAGIVLAGGQSSRMGEDKALTDLCGRPFVAHALEVLRTAGLAPQIAGGRSVLNQFAPVIADEEMNRGPLGGVVSALAQIEEDWAVFVSIDMPLMAPELVAFLVEDAQRTGCTATAPSVNGFGQTFPSVIRKEMLPALRLALAQRSGGCFAAFESAAHRHNERVRILAAEALAQTGQVKDNRGFWPHEWFLNVNTPVDLGKSAAAFERVHRII